MGKGFCALFKKDCRMLASGKFFLMALGFLAIYTAYVNLGYIRFMQMEPYNVYLYDPAGTQTEASPLVHAVPSLEAMDEALLSDANGVGLDAGAGDVRVVLYAGAENIDRHRADYALSLLRPSMSRTPEVIGTNTPEQKARREITCELLFNAMNIISEKEDGVAFVNEILPMTPSQYILQKVMVGFLCGSLSSIVTAMICFRPAWRDVWIMLVLIVLSSFVAAMIGLFIGKFSENLMVGVAYIKIVMLLFIAVPIVCVLVGVRGPLEAICNLVPSQPAFDGIMALSDGHMGTAIRDAGILAVHSIVWFIFVVS